MTLVLGFVLTTVILKVLDAIMGLRVSEDDEMAGLDLSQHSETAYALGGSSYGEYSRRRRQASARRCARQRLVPAGATSRRGGGLTKQLRAP